MYHITKLRINNSQLREISNHFSKHFSPLTRDLYRIPFLRHPLKSHSTLIPYLDHICEILPLLWHFQMQKWWQLHGVGRPGTTFESWVYHGSIQSKYI